MNRFRAALVFFILIWPGVFCRIEPKSPRSLVPPVKLSGGREFRTWESNQPLFFSQTYFVSAQDLNADDKNPGTAERPFKTIGRAAQVLKPGERVVIGSGIYRERVDPARGGTGPEKLISYEAAPDAQVVIRGSKEIPLASFSRDQKIGRLTLKPEWFTESANPFAISNVTPEQFAQMKWAADGMNNPRFKMPRGLVFQDGRRLRQETEFSSLANKEGGYWVKPGGGELFVHFFGAEFPEHALIEITTQSTVFAPRTENLGYLRVRGLTLEHAAGPWPFDEVGALSTSRGHHWWIEGNTVRQVNGAGVDIGRQKLEHYAPFYGRHIVRGNQITDCGIVGICGMGPHDYGINYSVLVEDNYLARNGFHQEETLYECAGIKLHASVGSLVRRNTVVDTLCGPGIWIDGFNAYTRVTENTILRSRGRGGLMFEYSFEPNLVDHNIIWDSSSFGILETDGRGQTFQNNYIGKCQSGIEIGGQQTSRVTASESGGHEIFDNQIVDCQTPILIRHDKSQVPSTVQGNITGF